MFCLCDLILIDVLGVLGGLVVVVLIVCFGWFVDFTNGCYFGC